MSLDVDPSIYLLNATFHGEFNGTLPFNLHDQWISLLSVVVSLFPLSCYLAWVFFRATKKTVFLPSGLRKWLWSTASIFIFTGSVVMFCTLFMAYSSSHGNIDTIYSMVQFMESLSLYVPMYITTEMLLHRVEIRNSFGPIADTLKILLMFISSVGTLLVFFVSTFSFHYDNVDSPVLFWYFAFTILLPVPFFFGMLLTSKRQRGASKYVGSGELTVARDEYNLLLVCALPVLVVWIVTSSAMLVARLFMTGLDSWYPVVQLALFFLRCCLFYVALVAVNPPLRKDFLANLNILKSATRAATFATVREFEKIPETAEEQLSQNIRSVGLT